MVLEPGMAFAFEPKLVFPGEGGIDVRGILAATQSKTGPKKG